jgi:hypothetical protein
MSRAEVVVWQCTKGHIFLSWSMATDIELCPSDHGSPIIKNVEILVYGFDRTERDLRIPTAHCQQVQPRWQV